MIGAFGDARTVYLDRAGHFLQVESPIRVHQVVAEALSASTPETPTAVETP